MLCSTLHARPHKTEDTVHSGEPWGRGTTAVRAAAGKGDRAVEAVGPSTRDPLICAIPNYGFTGSSNESA